MQLLVHLYPDERQEHFAFPSGDIPPLAKYWTTNAGHE